ncbi:hypothetical protein CSOJ01_11498 [Colletotrichum sojae]|uniref:Uncharacterized protein n=1 Tax=Colletotrichum sojae TaxID=2175907 RepID=A0A8H6IY02_9PEZI|nr:hypothetical protein CSOJ01_11498 [Colletotrichum sojae]
MAAPAVDPLPEVTVVVVPGPGIDGDNYRLPIWRWCYRFRPGLTIPLIEEVFEAFESLVNPSLLVFIEPYVSQVRNTQ